MRIKIVAKTAQTATALVMPRRGPVAMHTSG
jgi:hypothetical protein